jgi:hypothetical protein
MIDDVNGDPRRPLRTLTIRELVLELGNIEELVVRQADTAQNTYVTRFVTQREQQIIAELRSRACCLHGGDRSAAGGGAKAPEWES